MHLDKNAIRVAMICHFSNADVRSNLHLDNRRLYSFMRALLRMPTKKNSYGDIAPWDTNLIDFFREREDIELYVISAHSGLKRRIVSFVDKGVNYNFVKCELANMLKRIIPSDDLWRKMNPMTKDVHRLVHQIQPDIVLLVGAENAYYSSTVLGLTNYPVYTLCQTIYNNPERAAYSKINSKNATTEMAIFKEHKYFGVYCKMHYDLLRQIAPDSIIFKFGFPSKGVLLEPTPTEKEYDFVNFALEMSSKKGFPDAIEATAIVKDKYPYVKVNFVGGGSEEIKAELSATAERLGVKDNIIFTPFFDKHSDLLLHIQKSRFALLPCKMDNTSGTMTQAMQLGLPIVVYKTAGTPAFNREKQCALIAENGNVEELAQHMLSLMNNPELTETLKANAREFQEKKVVDARQNGERLYATFKAVIEHYKEGKIIPQELLFNPEKDD